MVLGLLRRCRRGRFCCNFIDFLVIFRILYIVTCSVLRVVVFVVLGVFVVILVVFCFSFVIVFVVVFVWCCFCVEVLLGRGRGPRARFCCSFSLRGVVFRILRAFCLFLYVDCHTV